VQARFDARLPRDRALVMPGVIVDLRLEVVPLVRRVVAGEAFLDGFEYNQ